MGLCCRGWLWAPRAGRVPQQARWVRAQCVCWVLAVLLSGRFFVFSAVGMPSARRPIIRRDPPWPHQTAGQSLAWRGGGLSTWPGGQARPHRTGARGIRRPRPEAWTERCSTKQRRAPPGLEVAPMGDHVDVWVRW